MPLRLSLSTLLIYSINHSNVYLMDCGPFLTNLRQIITMIMMGGDKKIGVT